MGVKQGPAVVHFKAIPANTAMRATRNIGGIRQNDALLTALSPRVSLVIFFYSQKNSASLLGNACSALCFVLFCLSYNSRSCFRGPRYHYGDFPDRIPWDSGLRLKKLAAALPLRPS